MANAATAFLSAGEYQRCLDYGQQVEDRVAESDSVWSRSLVRLDMATAMLGAGRRRDVEQAAQLGVEALEYPAIGRSDRSGSGHTNSADS
jgi:hypothetical protein